MKTNLIPQLLFAGLLALTAPNLRADEEQDLIAKLQSSASTPEKCAACQRLRLIGTAKSVPALAAQLGEERTGHAARYALEGLPCPEAGAALRQALVGNSGLIKAGLIDSLGWRRDVAAVPLLKPLLSDADATIASASASALGRIGGKQALTALEAVRKKAPAAVRPAVLESLLRCAERMMTEGNRSGAKKIYQSLFVPAEAESIRVAAYAGLIRSAGDHALAPIKSALEGGDSAAQIAALQLAGDLRDAKATATFTNLLARPTPALQTALLALLQRRGDVAAMPAVVRAARDSDSAVRVAAFAALGSLGDASVVPVLTEAAASKDEAEQKAARVALGTINRGAVADALVAQLATARPTVQVEIIRALTARREVSTVPKLLELARSPVATTRTAALQALAKLVDGSHLKSLVALLADAKDQAARDEVHGVFESLVERTTDPASLDVGPIVNGIASGETATRAALLKVSVLFADARVRGALRAALKDSDERIRNAADRALCNARDVELLPDLLELARTTTDTGLRALALEGYVRLACKTEGVGFSDQKRAELMQPAFALATRPEEKRMILSGLAVVPHPLALEMTEKACADPAVRAEAEIANLQIAKALAAHSELAETALKRLAADAANDNVRGFAQTLLRQLDTGWLAAGPYRQTGKQGQELFDIVFAPEQSDASQVAWRRAPGSPDSARAGELDLLPIAGGDHCVVYAKTRVYVPITQPVLFAIGSDDGIKLWVNNELVHANNAVRGLTPGEDKAKGKLHQGWNDLLTKITQHTAGCGLNLRILAPDGSAVPGLRLDPRGGASRLDTGFKRLQLSDEFYAEGAYFGDLNRDGKLDIIAGPFWFEGPDFTKRHEYRPATAFDPKGYSDNFLTYTGDFNGDGWTDIFCVPFPGKEGYWYENPSTQTGPWKQHLAYPMVGDESPMFGDVDGDGRPELIFCNEGYLGYAGPDPAKPDQPWVFHAISQKDGRYQRFTHGIGFGDINGDKRVDVIEAVGWWEQPADAKPDQPWIFHPFHFADAGAQMFIYDVDGDGLADIITAWHCHHYGLVWWQQIRKGAAAPDWQQHVILPPNPDLASPELRVSQLHAQDLVDINGDGLKDIVTGKRFWAHGPAGDPEPNAPAVLYWFELRREAGGKVSFVPHLIDDDSGVGTQVAAADVNGDGRPDVIVGNKKGIFVHLSRPTGQTAASSGHKHP